MVVLLIGFVLSAFVTLMLVRFERAHHLMTSSAWLTGPQSFHPHAVPRVGGVGIVLGLIASLGVLWVLRGSEARLGLVLLACAVPAFAAGLAEDVTGRQSPRRRLFFTAMSAGIAVWGLGATIDRTDLPGLDWLVGHTAGAFLVTVFAVSGVANAMNIIDGFNGLAAMCALMILGATAYVAFQAGDPMIGLWALAGLGAVMGFFIWNFPAGLILLGDGGAYLLGFYVAELSILLLYRNPAVSPMFPLLMCIYPIFETLFTMYRRKLVRGRPVGMPDGVHLHSLIYRRVIRWAVGNKSAKALTRRNSMTAPYLWMLCMFSVVPAVIFWDSSLILGCFIVLFGVTYVVLYARIVRFRSPGWMIVRH